MTKILLTGSAGFIGAHLADYILTNTDWQIVGLDRLDFAGDMSRTVSLDRKRFVQVFHDLRAPISGVTEQRVLTGNGVFSGSPFDFVAHLAAGSHVDRSVANPVEFFQDNVLGTVHLLEYARKWLDYDGVCLYFSTDEVFGPGEFKPHQPWARFNPLNPYAAAKAGGEAACPAWVNCYGMRIIITHATNVIGPGQDHEKFLPLAVAKALERKPIPVHKVGGRPCTRFYTDHENVSSAVLHLLERGTCINPDDAQSGRYNITGEREISNVELVESVGQILGVPVEIKLIENPPTRVRPDSRYYVDGSALEATGWKRPVSFEDGLKRTVLAIRDELTGRPRAANDVFPVVESR